jgi:hypothetical protein
VAEAAWGGRQGEAAWGGRLATESCLEGVNRQVKTFSTKTRNKLRKTT